MIETRLAASSPREERARYVGAIPAGCSRAREGVTAVVGCRAGGGASFVSSATVDVNGGWYMARPR